MNTKLKVILTAVSLAALASPVMATESNQSAADISQAHASAHVRHHVYARARIGDTPIVVTPGHRPLVEDCIHIAFPQCGGDSEQVLR